MAGPGGDPERAVEYAERAARHAILRLGYEEGAAYFRHALQLLPGLGDEGRRRIELLLGLGEASVRASDWPGGLEAYERAAAEAARLDRPRDLARAALGVGARLAGFEVRLHDRRQAPESERWVAEVSAAAASASARRCGGRSLVGR